MPVWSPYCFNFKDIVQLAGGSGQYKESAANARILSEKIGKSELTFVGHSPGRGEAALNALITDKNTITFNAAGVGNLTKVANGGLSLPFKIESKFAAIIMLTDPLNVLQKRLKLPAANGLFSYLKPKDF